MILALKINEEMENEHRIVLSESDFERVMSGETLRHPTCSREVSGTWEVVFKKNSPEKHKQIYGV